MFTTRPHLAASMSGSADCVTWNVPVRFTEMMRSHCSVVMSMKRSNPSLPAPFTSTSTGPSSPRTCSTAASTAARSDTSTTHAIATPPSSRISVAACSACSPSRSKIATLAPSAARRSLIASPIPDAPPVTMAVDPKNDITLSPVARDSHISRGTGPADTVARVGVPVPHLLEDLDRELSALGDVMLHDPLRFVRVVLLDRGEDALVVARRGVGPTGHELEVAHGEA